MAKQVQLRGGTTSQHSSFTGVAREVTVDTDKDTIVVHDGSTAGGVPLAKASELPTLTSLSVTATAAELNILDGVTSTAAELNILDGVTSTAAELNYTDGVTSAIQTQLDTKLSSVADNSVTLAKMASGTDGNLITYDASGDPAYVTTGTSGQVLTSGGTGVAPTFQTVDADTAKTDTAQAFTEDQTFEAITETVTAKSAGFTPDLSNDGTLYSCSGTMTITMPTAESGKSFTIIHATATSITWAGTIKWNGGSAPTAGSGIDIYVFVSDGTNWYGMQSGTGFA